MPIQFLSIGFSFFFLALAIFVYFDMRKIQRSSAKRVSPGLYSLLIVAVAWVLNYAFVYYSFGLGLSGALPSTLLLNPFVLRIIAIALALTLYFILRIVKKNAGQGASGDVVNPIKDNKPSLIGLIAAVLFGIGIISASISSGGVQGSFRQLLPFPMSFEESAQQKDFFDAMQHPPIKDNQTY